MRSRYAAFALGLGEYLADTLSSDHEDRAASRTDLVRELSRARERQRFMGLTIVHAEGSEVLFLARIFERGTDRSFAELSTFAFESGSWRYAHGVSVPAANLPGDPSTLTRESFLALASGQKK
jgi:SEC-C motif-containing protein